MLGANSYDGRIITSPMDTVRLGLEVANVA